MEDAVNLARLLSERLGAGAVLTDPADMVRYCRDWHGDVTTGAVAVLRPASTDEVSAAVRLCAELGLSIVPQGGNTGLALGGIPDRPQAEVVLSLERMNRIRSIAPDDFSAIVDAGCVLESIKVAVDAAGCYFPLALGAQGSCQIGGNVSTNAGGINVLRYGMTRELILGLEVVLADGTVWNGLSRLRKDNRGIDLKQLFIGAEGTLGVVTGVAIKLLPKPEHVETALLALPSVEAAMALYRRARRDCCDLISAFELPPFFRSAPDEGVPIGQLSGWAETGQAAIGAFPADAARYVEMSPLFSAADLRAPALLIESDLERPRMGKLFGVLYRLNRDAALLTYYGEGHVLASPANLRDLHAHILAWLARYLGPPARDASLPMPGPGLDDGG